MDKRKMIFRAAALAGAAAFCRSRYEINHIKAVEYKLYSKKLPEKTGVKIVFLCDLHCRSYGEGNIELLRLVRAQDPDFILTGGDMITASKGNAQEDLKVMKLLRALAKIAPVYCAMGNHEEYLKCEKRRFGDRFEKIKEFLEREGILLLQNGHVDLKNNISVYGLEISRKYYRRFSRKSPKSEHMEKYLGRPDPERYNILLAHHPAFFDAYEAWKPDLVLSGHYHGGVLRLPLLGGVVSPDLRLFPAHCAGRFKKNETEHIVSAGCGSHSINIRLFNMPEVLAIELSSETELI